MLGSIRGRVVLPDGTLISESVKLTLQSARGTQTVSYTDNQGQFEFRGLAPDNYRLEVEADRQRFEIVTESVQVNRGIPSILNIALREKRSASGSKSDERAVSVGELDPNVPEPARKEFDRASKANKEGKADESIAHLRKAIQLYPHYLMARNDLGAQLLEQGRLEEAADELRQAISIDAKAFNPQLNLGVLFVRQHRFSEAADSLRKALSLNPSSPAANLYAGLAALGLEDWATAEKQLKAAYDLGGSAYALALFHLGQLYMGKGERQLALKAFETYLHDAPGADNAAEVRKMIGMLQ
jgi:tetratricopeptide (TPR) repeat protein